jgi:hypothetical protein
MGSRFVRPDTTVLRISNGDTLTVKRRLNAGEQRAMFARMYAAGVDGNLKVNPLETGIARVTAYLVDWSLTDDEGKRVDIRGLSIIELTSVIDGLDPGSFAEIKDAIEKHELAMDAERVQEKNDQGGENTSSAISSSPGSTAGATSGSTS